MKQKNIAIAALILIMMLRNLLSIIDFENTVATANNATLSCIHPTSVEQKAACKEVEQQILAATVRIEMQAQYYIQDHRYTQVHPSHATILAGRYLVTHNHFKFPLQKKVADGGEGYLALSLRQADGTLILEQAPLNTFNIIHVEPQGLVLEFTNPNGKGLFTSMGLTSADCTDWREIALRHGTELAQVNWDGKQARVDWVQVEILQLEDAVPLLQLNNFARFGSSGGGIYWQGQHIGNNWARNIEKDPKTGEITRKYSIIALNSPSIANLDRAQ
jgi:hypothetical protein